MFCELDMHANCHMREHCQKYDVCPMALSHQMLSGKWKILILWFLADGTLRFSDIRRRLPGVTQKMITQQLRGLEEDRLITRRVYPEVPPRVEYSLTELGRRLVPLLEQMHDFGAEYLAQNPDKAGAGD